MEHGPVTIGNLIDSGKCIEVGCYGCWYHVYIDAAVLAVPADTPVPALSQMLKCPQCKTVNREPGYPIWARPDTRPPKMGAGN